MSELLEHHLQVQLVSEISMAVAETVSNIEIAITDAIQSISEDVTRVSDAMSLAAKGDPHEKANRGPDPFKDNAVLSAVLDSLGKQAGLHGLTAPENIEKAVNLEFEKLHSIAAIRHTALDYINRNFEHEDKLLKPVQLPNERHDPRICVANTALAQTDRGTGQ